MQPTCSQQIVIINKCIQSIKTELGGGGTIKILEENRSGRLRQRPSPDSGHLRVANLDQIIPPADILGILMNQQPNVWQMLMTKQWEGHLCDICSFDGKHALQLWTHKHRLSLGMIDKQLPWNIENGIVLGHAHFAQGAEGERDGYSYYQDSCTCVTHTSQFTHESKGGNGHIWGEHIFITKFFCCKLS